MTKNYTKFGSFNTSTNGLILISETIGRPTIESRIDNLSLYGVASLDDKSVQRSRRELTFEYVVFDASQWPTVYENMSKQIDGKKLEIKRSIEPDYTYIGRCRLDPFKCNRGTGLITVVVDAEPYKYTAVNTITFNTALSMSITPDTGCITPAVITITPLNSTTGLTLKKLARDRIKWTAENIVLNAFTAAEQIVIDGERHTVKIGNDNAYATKIKTMWEWPALIPGTYTIESTSDLMSIQIKYRGRYI